MSLYPAATLRARCHPAMPAAASSVNAVIKSLQEILDHLDTGRRGQEVYRTPLVQPHCGTFQPLLRLLARPEDIGCLGQNRGQLPSSPTLFLTEQFRARGGVSLVGALAHANRLCERIIPVEHDQSFDQMR